MNCFPDSKSSMNSMLKANLGGIGFFLYVVNLLKSGIISSQYGLPGRGASAFEFALRMRGSVSQDFYLIECSSEPGFYGPFFSDTFPLFSCFAHLSQGSTDHLFRHFSFHFSCSSEPGVLVAVPCDRLVPHCMLIGARGLSDHFRCDVQSHFLCTLGSS